jgi:hypothetical protein
VIDITNPSAPTEVGYYDLPGGAYGMPEAVAVSGGVAYVAEDWIFRIYDCSAALAVSQSDVGAPKEYALLPCYPNPFNSSTTISYALPVAGPVRVVAYDLQGRSVMTLLDGRINAGEHQVKWNANGLASGSYFVRLESPQFQQTQKVVLLK